MSAWSQTGTGERGSFVGNSAYGFIPSKKARKALLLLSRMDSL
jgi:hypothetical protein